jgi:phospholipase/lecithinase/hemolysin
MRFALLAALLGGIPSSALAGLLGRITSSVLGGENVGQPQLGTLPDLDIKEIVAFGDSLTDTGVVAELTKYGTPIPSDAYYKGRFTNGKVWVEYVVESQNLKLQNFAAGGATTSDALLQGWVGGKFGEPLQNGTSIQPVPGVDTQISTYLKDEWKRAIDDTKYLLGLKKGWFKRRTLYTIFVGANDDFDNDYLKLGKNASYFASAQLDEWKALATFGAVNIMPMVLPSFTPFFSNYSLTIDQLIVEFKKTFPLVNIVKYEVPFAAFIPTSYTPNLIGDPERCCNDCFIGLPPKGNATLCSTVQAEQNKYLNWDLIHPTTIVHKFIADDVRGFIGRNFGCGNKCDD